METRMIQHTTEEMSEHLSKKSKARMKANTLGVLWPTNFNRVWYKLKNVSLPPFSEEEETHIFPYSHIKDSYLKNKNFYDNLLARKQEDLSFISETFRTLYPPTGSLVLESLITEQGKVLEERTIQAMDQIAAEMREDFDNFVQTFEKELPTLLESNSDFNLEYLEQEIKGEFNKDEFEDQEEYTLLIKEAMVERFAYYLHKEFIQRTYEEVVYPAISTWLMSSEN